MGMKIATVVAVDARSAPHTWLVPRSLASAGVAPVSRRRTMFSSTTIAASSTMPVAKARPASEITLSERPVGERIANVASSDTGIASAMISVARHWRRNSHRTPMASSTPAMRLPVNKLIERLM